MIDEVVFQGEAYGVTIVRRDSRLFLQWDAGEISSLEVEAEISVDEVEKVKRNEGDAYQVILACERRGAVRRVRPAA